MLEKRSKKLPIISAYLKMDIQTGKQGRNKIDNVSLEKLARLYGVSVDYLLGHSDEIRPKRKGIKIPVLGKVPAGVPFEAIEEILDYEEITPEMAQKGPHFALRIEGNSMEPDITRL